MELKYKILLLYAAVSVTAPDVNVGIVTALLDTQGNIYGVVG